MMGLRHSLVEGSITPSLKMAWTSCSTAACRWSEGDLALICTTSLGQVLMVWYTRVVFSGVAVKVDAKVSRRWFACCL